MLHKFPAVVVYATRAEPVYSFETLVTPELRSWSADLESQRVAGTWSCYGVDYFVSSSSRVISVMDGMVRVSESEFLRLLLFFGFVQQQAAVTLKHCDHRVQIEYGILRFR